MESNETMIFTNAFGSVTDKRIIVTTKHGMEDIPLRQVSSIAFRRKRSVLLAVAYLIACILIVIFLANLETSGGWIVPIAGILLILFLLAAIAQYIGHHVIVIGTSGKDRKPIKVEMAKTREGRAFVDAIRQQIIRG